MGLLNKLSYPQRLFVWLLGYSLLMVGCFVVFQYHREKEFKAEEIDKQLQLINTYILTELGEGHYVPDIRLDDFKPFDDIRVSVISDKGHIIYMTTHLIPCLKPTTLTVRKYGMPYGMGRATL